MDFIVDHTVKFSPNQEIPARLGLKEIEVLTGRTVLDMVVWGKWVKFILDNGMRISVKNWI